MSLRIKNIAAATFLLYFIVVLINSGQFISAFQENKVMFAFASAIAGSLISLYSFFKLREKEIIINLLDLLLFVYFFYVLLSSFYTPTGIINQETISLFLLIVFFSFLKAFLSDYNGKEMPLKIILYGFLSIGLMESLIGLFQVHTLFGFSKGYYLITGSFDNPNYYSSYIVSLLPFSAGIYLYNKNTTKGDLLLKYLGIITSLVIILALPLTKTRGDWLAGATGLIFVLFVRYKLHIYLQKLLCTAFRKITFALSVCILFVFVMSVLYNIRPSSADGRLLMWKISSNIIEDNPVVGRGYGSFGVDYNNYQASYFGGGNGTEREIYLADNVYTAHNEFIQIWAELGILGLLLFLGTMAASFVNIKGKRKVGSNEVRYNYEMILTSARGGILAICVSALFSFPFHIFPTFINLFFFLGLISASYKGKGLLKYKLNRSQIKTISITAVILFAILFFDTAQKQSKYKEWKNAIIYSKLRNYSKAAELYTQLYPDLYKNGEFLLNYGGTLSLAEADEKAIQILNEAKNYVSHTNLFISLGNSYKRLSDYKKAEQNYEYASDIVPNRLYPKYLLAKMYFEKGDLKAAQKTARLVLSGEAKFPSTAEEQIKNEMQKIVKPEKPARDGIHKTNN